MSRYTLTCRALLRRSWQLQRASWSAGLQRPLRRRERRRGAPETMPACSLRQRRAQLLLPLHELCVPCGAGKGLAALHCAIEGDCREREEWGHEHAELEQLCRCCRDERGFCIKLFWYLLQSCQDASLLLHAATSVHAFFS